MYGKFYKRGLQPVASVENLPNVGEYRLYCLDVRFASFVRQLAVQLDNPYNFYSSLASGGYITTDADTFNVVSAIIAEGVSELMSGCNLEEKFDDLILAVQGLSSCCAATSVGSQYAGATSQPPNDFIDTGANFPPVYADRSEFDALRCNMAHQIVVDVQSDVSFLSTLDAVTATLLGLAAGFVTPAPGDGLFYALAMLVATSSVGAVFFADVLNVLQQEEDNLACVLYSANTVEEARDGFISTMALSQYWGSQVFNGMFQSGLPAWLSWTNLNRLYDGTVPEYTGGDCTGCWNGCGDAGTWQHFPLFASFGDGYIGTSGDDLTITASNVYGPDGYRYAAFFGGDYQNPPLSARRLVHIDTDNTLLNGETSLGYIQLFGPSFSDILGAIGYNELDAVNAMLAASNTCVSVVALSYAKQQTVVTCTFE